MRKKSFSRLISFALSATLAFTSAVTGGPALDVRAAAEVNKLTYSFIVDEGDTAPTKDAVTLIEPKGSEAGTDVSAYYKRTGTDDEWVYTKETANAKYDGSSDYYNAGTLANLDTWVAHVEGKAAVPGEPLDSYYRSTGDLTYTKASGTWNGEETGFYLVSGKVETPSADDLENYYTRSSEGDTYTYVKAEAPFDENKEYYLLPTQVTDQSEWTAPEAAIIEVEGTDVSSYYTKSGTEAAWTYTKAVEGTKWNGETEYYALSDAVDKTGWKIPTEAITNTAITEATLPDVPEKAGYTGKWSFADNTDGITWDATNQKISFTSAFLDSMYTTGYEAEFTATYTEIPYTVVFDPNGGTKKSGSESKFTVSDVKIESDPSIAAPKAADIEAPDGKAFIGWAYTKNATTALSQMPAELTAELIEKADNNKITFYAVYKDLEEVEFTVAPVTAADNDKLLGKTAADLQSGMTIAEDSSYDGVFTGTLKYVTGYNQFDSTLNSGYYFAYKVNAPAESQVDVKIKEGDTEKYSATLDDDMINIVIVSESISNRQLEVTVSKTGYTTVTKTYSLAGISLEDPFTVSPVGTDDEGNLYGHTAADLQESMALGDSDDDFDGKFTGTLNYVDDGWNAGTWGDDLKSGYYFAFKAVPVDESWTVTATLYNADGTEANKQVLKEDDGYVHVVAVSRTISTKTLEIQATAASGAKVTRVYDLSGITVNEMFSVAPVTAADNAKLLGKTAADLQSGMAVVASDDEEFDGKFTGTLKFVTDYEGFSSLEKEQVGHYFAFKVNAAAGSTVTAQIYEGTDLKLEQTLDEDMIDILIVSEKISNRWLKVTVNKGAYTTEKKYDLSGLVLEDVFTTSPVTAADNANLYGQTASNLQSSMILTSSGQFVGNLKYVNDGWKPGTWGDDLKAGFYFAFKAVPKDDTVKVTATLYNKDGSEANKQVLNKDDGYVHVVAVSNTISTKKLVITAETAAGAVYTREYSLAGITVEDFFSVVPATDKDGALFGKKASALQSGMTVTADPYKYYDGVFSGTLKYVSGYTDFSSIEAEQSGHYFAYKVNAPVGSTVTAKIIREDSSEIGPWTLDKDMTQVLIVSESISNRQLEVTVTKGAYSTTKTYSLSGLTLQTPFTVAPVTASDNNYLYGKKATDLQSSMKIEKKTSESYSYEQFTGKLKFVNDGWKTGTWGEDMSSGYYFAFKAKPVDDNWTIRATIGSSDQGELKEDDGYVHVAWISDTEAFKNKGLIITATSKSGATITKYYSLAGVEVEDLFTVTPVTDKDNAKLLGKKASDLQSGMAVVAPESEYSEYEGRFEGTLKYVTGYTGFSSAVAEQSGHYFAYKVNAAAGSTVTVRLLDGATEKLKQTLDEDMIHILIAGEVIQDRNLEVSVKTGTTTVTKKYDLSGLTLEAPFTVSPVSAADEEHLYGKKATDLQSNMNLKTYADYGGVFSGTLRFVDGGWDAGTWGEDMSSGYYFAFKAVPVDENWTISAKIYNYDTGVEADQGELNADDGYVHVVYVGSNLEDRALIITATATSGAKVTREYDLSDVLNEDLTNRITVTTPTITATRYEGAVDNKKINEIQSGITIVDNGDNGYITGALRQIVGWNAFGGDLGSGHYIAIKATAPGAKKLEAIVDGGDGNIANLTKDEDKTAVLRIRNKRTQKIVVKATFAGDKVVTKTFALDKLDLEGFEADTNLPMEGEGEDAEEVKFWGIAPSDMQENVWVDSRNNVIGGTLKYVEDYSSAFGEGMNKGHYIALNADLPNVKTLEYGINGTYSTAYNETLDKDDILDRELILFVSGDDYGEYRTEKNGKVLTLKATYADGSWEQRTYDLDLFLEKKDHVTVRYEYNNSESLYDPDYFEEYYSKGDKLTKPADPSIDGFDFVGWGLNGDWFDEEDILDFATYTIPENTTEVVLFAKWKPVEYKIHFDKNNDSAIGTMEDQTTTYSWPEPLFANQFVCDGYEFVGWSRTAGGNVEFTDRQIIKDLSKIKDDVVHLYAVWTEKGVSKNYWVAEWDWYDYDHSYAELTLRNVNDYSNTVTFKVFSTKTVTYIGTDTRTTYFVECTFNGVKYTDSYTTINGEVVTTDAFSYTGVEDPYTYTGKAIKLDNLKVYWGDSILVEGTDYTLKYKNNTNAGTATVTITGKGQFDKAFDETIPYVIEQADISSDAFAVDNPVILDTAKVADPKLMFGKAAVNKKLYTVRYSEGAETKQIPVAGQEAAVDVYTGTIEPLPGGNYTGEREFTLTVIKSTEAIPASKLKVKFDKITAISQEQVDSADGYVPTFTVSNGKDKVTSDNKTKSAKDAQFDDLFTVEYLNNHSAGTATVIITAADDCELGGKKVVGSIKKTFNIPGTKFSKEQKKAFNAIKNKTVPYTGYAYDLEGVLNALCEETHIYNPYEYVPGLEYERDWNVSAYAKNIKKGTMTITITGSGIYKDTVKVPVKIGAYTDYAVSFDGLIDSNYVPSAGDPNDPENEPFRTPNEVSYKAGGTTVTGLTVRALDGDYFLREGVDYTVSYENNKMLYSDAKNKKKVAYLVIKGKGNYGTKKIAFTVVPNDFNEYSLYVVPNEILEKQKVATATAISNGKAKAPAVFDAVTGKKLTAGKDFGYRYEDFDPATSSFPVVITGLGTTYCGEAVFAGYHVYGAKLVGSGKKANIALIPMLKKYYTGKPITLGDYDFEWSADKARFGEDFEIIGYKNNIKAGNASVTVKAIGDRFGGTVTLKFKINKAKKIEN